MCSPLIAINQIGIAANLVNILFIGIVAALALAFGLAFGLGGREVAGQLTQSWYVHTPRGTPATVTVRSEADRVVLEVADAGPGMSETARSRAFERFFRADPSRSRDSGGSGLGLAIVAAIARAYGGNVRVESEPGKGSSFRVDWPAVAVPAVALDPPGG